MESTLLIILIVVAVVLLALSVIILILLLKRGTVEKTPSPESEEIKTLSANLQSLHNDVQNVTVGLATLKESIPLVISQKTAEQMASLQHRLELVCPVHLSDTKRSTHQN